MLVLVSGRNLGLDGPDVSRLPVAPSRFHCWPITGDLAGHPRRMVPHLPDWSLVSPGLSSPVPWCSSERSSERTVRSCRTAFV